MQDVKLRDRRKPGHCWQDNELYDAFGPVIGGAAVLVYVTLSRHCYGTEIRCSARELAESTGSSKDTVLRALKVMERVGMLRAADGATQGKLGEYNLVDLKELALHYGASYDLKRSSYLLPAEETVRLKAEVAAVMRELRGGLREQAGGLPGRIAVVPNATVSQGDSSPDLNCLTGGTELSHQEDATVSPEGQSTSYYKTAIQQDVSTPTPSRGEGGDEAEARDARIRELRAEVFTLQRSNPLGGEWRAKAQELLRLVREREPQQQAAGPAAAEVLQAPETDDLELLTDWVMQRCGFTHKRARWAIRATIGDAAKPERRQLASAMVKAWHRYVEAGPQLRWSKSPQNFFRDSYWQRDGQWPWDRERLAVQAAAGVGGR